MKLNKIAAVILALVVLMANSTVLAENLPKIEFKSSSGYRGDTVDVELYLKNPKNLKTLGLELDYDKSILSLNNDSGKRNDSFKEWTYTSNVQNDIGKFNLNAVNPNGFTNDEDVLVCVLKFKISDTAVEGNTKLKISSVEGYYSDSVLSGITSHDGIVEVKAKKSGGNNNDSHNTVPIKDIPKTPEKPSAVLKDIAGYSWAEKEINFLVAKNIINGIGNNEFAPQSNITRADYTLLLFRMSGLKSNTTDGFSDVAKDDYYFDAVNTAKTLGIIQGGGENNFSPHNFISRQDMFVIAYRILVMKNIITESNVDLIKRFLDFEQISDYARTAMASLYTNGLISGYNNTLTPKSNATRAETAVFIYRLYEFINK